MVKQEAAQMWCLTNLLPLMIGHKIPAHDNKWKVLLKLLDAVQYICAPSIHRALVEIMRECINDFLESFATEFPTQTMKPKAHYMTHYAD